MPPVRVQVLGPLRLTVSGAPVEVPGPKRRAVLALLALAEGRTVPVDTLLDALWPAGVPESGRAALHSHVSRLRTLLGPGAAQLTTPPDGYRLSLDADDLDLTRARTLLGRGDLPALREAHALWRGVVLPDLSDVAPLAAAVEEIRRLREAVVDALVAAAVEAGEAGTVVGVAEDAHAEDPLREAAAVGLMRALAADGRAAEALRIGRAHRRRLAEETGLDPSPVLAAAEREIAGGGLGAPAPPAPARPATALLGRDDEVAELRRLLAGERLVTLAGPGGMGKTRVALEIARLSGAPTVLLAPVAAAPELPHALAAALRLSVERGDVLDACVAVLGDRPTVLVLDNCEHLRDGVRDLVERLLTGCPRVTVLATSREPLGLPAEVVRRLGPLAPSPAAELFLERARRVRPGVPTATERELVADVVRRLDGMPLALELAAGRLSGFGLADLHGRLDRALDLLGGPRSEARHATLRATVEWSYQLLGAAEQRLFRHLAVFPDGLALGAAERLAADVGLDGDPGVALSRLVDASMVVADFTDGTRYRMLETLRAYGLDRLAAAEETAAGRQCLCHTAVRLVGWIETGLAGAEEPAADALLRRELPTLRAAWRSARSAGDLDTAVAVVAALFDVVAYRDLVEVRSWAEELAEDPALAGHPRCTTVLAVAAEAAYHRGDHATADQRARAAGDLWLGRAVRAVVALARGAFGEAVEHSLVAARTAPPGRETLVVAALAAAYDGDLDRARQLHRDGAAGTVSPTMRSWSAYVAGEIDALAGADDTAEAHYRRSLELARASGATFLVGVATVGLLSALVRAGRTAGALRGYAEVVDEFARTGNWTHLWATLRNLAVLLRSLGDPETADVIDSAADRAPDAPVDPGRPPVVGDAGPSRAEVLALVRTAVARELGRA